MADKVPVTFQVQHGGYNAGETAGFDKQRAGELVKGGVCAYHHKGAAESVTKPVTEEAPTEPGKRKGRRGGMLTR